MVDPAIERLVERVAAHGLGAGTTVVATSPLDSTAWVDLSTLVVEHRLVGVLAAAIDDGAMAVDEAQHTEVAAQLEAHMVSCLALERTLLEADRLLDAAEVPVRVLKGPALAHTVAMAPQQRSFGDIDLLCPSSLFDRAVAALVRAGARRRLPELAPGYDRRFAKSVTLEWGPHEIDLHRTLAAGPFGLWIDEDTLWAEPHWFMVGGRRCATLDRERHLVHACYHAVLGDIEPRLASLRDIALLAAHPDLDGGEVRRLASIWRGEPVVAAGLRLAAERLPVEHSELSAWAQTHEADPDQQRALAAYRVEHRRFARQSLAMLRALPWGERPAFARAVVWPSGANLEARGLDRRRHLLRR